MTPLAIAMAIVCELALVCGQLLLKRGISATPVRPAILGLGVACLSGWFFLWMALLAKWELSRLFPFEGLNPALVVLGAVIFLKERVPPMAWIGILLISAGVAVVTSS